MEILVLIYGKIFTLIRDRIVYQGYPSWLMVSVVGSLLVLLINAILKRNTNTIQNSISMNSVYRKKED